ncbi:MAG: glycine cleavage system protein GcvH [Pirellula sp.]|jgi:glycine cleavage system H protein|nr:glycine cleavage system protein GcvH [Pirellula sp.]
MTIQPQNLKYCESHEWVAPPADNSGIATVGISAFAVAQLNDIVFMALPTVGQSVSAGQEFGEVESVKAVSPMYSPVSGEVVEVHSELVDHLDRLNADPYEQGWIIKVKMSDPSELNRLLDYAAYEKMCAEQG